MRRIFLKFFFTLLSCLFFFPMGLAAQELTELRVGFLPNLTHAQAIIGKKISLFERKLGSKIKVKWKVFPTSSGIIDGLFINEIDIAYLGPNPAANGFLRSHGNVLKIVSGSSAGGVAFITRQSLNIKTPAKLKGKKIAFPNIGGTQDLALRDFLRKNSLKPRSQGGDVELYNIRSADQLTLFKKGQLDASWAPEPWATLLCKQAGGEVFFQEKTLWEGQRFATTVLVMRKDFLKNHPELAREWIQIHKDITVWINQNPEKAVAIIDQEIKNILGRSLPFDVLEEAFTHIEFTWDPLESTIVTMVNRAFVEGYFDPKFRSINLDELFELTLLEALQNKGTH